MTTKIYNKYNKKFNTKKNNINYKYQKKIIIK